MLSVQTDYKTVREDSFSNLNKPKNDAIISYRTNYNNQLSIKEKDIFCKIAYTILDSQGLRKLCEYRDLLTKFAKYIDLYSKINYNKKGIKNHKYLSDIETTFASINHTRKHQMT